MDHSAQPVDLVNDPDDRIACADDLYLPPGHRHGIGHRIASGDATKKEVIHHLLGANADDTLTGGLAEVHVLAEMLADLLEGDRAKGTLARIVASRIEVLISIAELLIDEGTSS